MPENSAMRMIRTYRTGSVCAQGLFGAMTGLSQGIGSQGREQPDAFPQAGKFYFNLSVVQLSGFVFMYVLTL